MVCGARNLKVALFLFADEVELGVLDHVVLGPLINPQHAPILFGILGEHTVCSDLCKHVVPQWSVGGRASLEAAPVPPASEIDRIIAHGTKLLALLSQGQKIEQSNLDETEED